MWCRRAWLGWRTALCMEGALREQGGRRAAAAERLCAMPCHAMPCHVPPLHPATGPAGLLTNASRPKGGGRGAHPSIRRWSYVRARFMMGLRQRLIRIAYV